MEVPDGVQKAGFERLFEYAAIYPNNFRNYWVFYLAVIPFEGAYPLFREVDHKKKERGL
jgi:hypothetical protein